MWLLPVFRKSLGVFWSIHVVVIQVAAIKNLHYPYAAASGIPPRRNPAVPTAMKAVEENRSQSVEVTTMSTDAIRPQVMTPASSASRLGASLHIKGDISGKEDLHVDGNVDGLIQLEDCKLTLGPSAKLTGDVAAREVVVYGSVKGNLRGCDRIEIKKDGSVVGDLTTNRIIIEDGAHFKGSIEIARKTTDASTDSDKPAYARAAVATVDPKPKTS